MSFTVERKTFTGTGETGLEKHLKTTKDLYPKSQLRSVHQTTHYYRLASDVMTGNPVSTEFLIVWEYVK